MCVRLDKRIVEVIVAHPLMSELLLRE